MQRDESRTIRKTKIIVAMETPEETMSAGCEDFSPPDDSELTSIPVGNSGTTTNFSRETDESGELSESTDFSEYGTDFAAQLRKQRRQVLEKDEQRNLFAESLKKHREQLVDTWEVNHTSIVTPQDESDKDDAGCRSSGSVNEEGSTKVNGNACILDGRDPSTTSILEALEDGINDDGDEDFGAFEDAKLGDGSKASSADDQFFDASILSDGGGDNGDDDEGMQTVPAVLATFLSFDNLLIDPTTQRESPPISSVIVNGNVPHMAKENTGELDLSQQQPTLQIEAAGASGQVQVTLTAGSIVEADDNFFGDFTQGTNNLGQNYERREDGEKVQNANVDYTGEVDASPTASGHITLAGFDGTGEPQLTESVDNECFGVEAVSSSSRPIESSSLRSNLGDQYSSDLGGAWNYQPQEAEKYSGDNTSSDFGDAGLADSAGNGGLGVDAFSAFNDPVPTHMIPESSDEKNDDTFGDFIDTGSSPPHLVAATEDVDNGDAFGDVDHAASPQIQVDPTMEENIDDVFNDVDQAALPQPETNSAAADDIVFGDFEDTAQPHPESACSCDDGLGNVGKAAPSQPEASTSVEILDDFDDVDPSQSELVTSDGDHAFGDVDGLSSQPQKVTTEMDDDDFGDFDDAGFSQPRALATANGDDKDYDSFGDFDDAGRSQHQPLDDDAFGDFDDPGPAQDQTAATKNDDQPVEEVDDDEFGDFDDAPSQPCMVPSPTKHDGDDAAFGDFDGSGPTHYLSSAQDESISFGNFDYDSVQASEILPPVAPMGEIGDKTRRVFATMQEKYSFPSSDVDNPEDEKRSDPESALGNLLPSRKSPVENKVSLEFELLDQALRGLSVAKGTCSLILDGDGVGPFSPFIYPVGGFRAPDAKVEVDQLKKSSIRPTPVPDILPIQLPTGRKMPLNASSPATGRKTTTHALITGLTIPEFSSNKQQPLGGESTLEPSSAKKEQLLSMVPDLSFMLQSSLTLAKK